MSDITVTTFIAKGGEITKKDFYRKFEEVTHCDGNFLDKNWELVNVYDPTSKIMLAIVTAFTLAFAIAGAVCGGSAPFSQLAGTFGAINVTALIAAVSIHIKAKSFGDLKIIEKDVRKELAQFIELTKEEGNLEFFKAVGRRIKLD
jgi:hypothetical protein